MDINKFIFGASGILLMQFLRSYKPYTLTHRAAKLAEHTVPKRHVYNQIFLYFRKPDVKNYPLFRSLLPGHDRWFQTTASNEYRSRQRGNMDSKGNVPAHSSTVKNSATARSSSMKNRRGHIGSPNSFATGRHHRIQTMKALPKSVVLTVKKSAAVLIASGDKRRSFCHKCGTACDDDWEETERKAQDELAVFVGNLRTDVDDATLRKNIMAVFAVAGVHISAVQVVFVHKAFATHAFVYLTSMEEKIWILKGLGSQLDLSNITIPGKKLKVRSKSFGAVRYRRPEHSSMQMSSLTERPSIESSGSISGAIIDAAGQAASGMQAIDEDNSDESDAPKEDELHPIHPQQAALATTHKLMQGQVELAPIEIALRSLAKVKTPMKGSDHSTNDNDVPAHTPRSNWSNSTEMQTQTIREALHLSKTNVKFYMLGQNLGNESRHIEFKAGQGSYLQKQLKDHVAKYMCAFLNSEGGILLVGVNDEGEVLGIQCTQRIEDLLRQKMDATIKEIAPQVFPHMYTIDFLPVCDISGMPIENRKILEIAVKRNSCTTTLYQTHQGHVFIRRDGSVQGPLKANDIQEWTRVMMQREFEEREAALRAMHRKDRRMEIEMEKQRRMTMVLTRELQTQRKSARILKQQLRRADPKHYIQFDDDITSTKAEDDILRITAKIEEDIFSATDKWNIHAGDIETKPADNNAIRHTIATSTPVNNAPTTSVGTDKTASTPPAPKSRTASIVSRISAVIKSHRSNPLKSTPSRGESSQSQSSVSNKEMFGIGNVEGLKIPQGTALVQRKRSTKAPTERLSSFAEVHPVRSKTCVIM